MTSGASMKIAITHPVSVAVVVTILAACTDNLALNEPDNFGAAVRHNIEAQVVNPNPQPEAGPIPMDGSRAGIAMNRYQTDRVKQPRPLHTSTINVFNSGESGGQ
jgi:hypothetical protein